MWMQIPQCYTVKITINIFQNKSEIRSLVWLSKFSNYADCYFPFWCSINSLHGMIFKWEQLKEKQLYDFRTNQTRSQPRFPEPLRVKVLFPPHWLTLISLFNIHIWVTQCPLYSIQVVKCASAIVDGTMTKLKVPSSCILQLGQWPR